jgi:hypothetical protein
MVEAKRVARLVERYRIKVRTGWGKVSSPGLSVVKVQISSKIAAVGWWIEAVGQNASHAVECVRVSVAVIASHKSNVDVCVRERLNKGAMRWMWGHSDMLSGDGTG